MQSSLYISDAGKCPFVRVARANNTFPQTSPGRIVEQPPYPHEHRQGAPTAISSAPTSARSMIDIDDFPSSYNDHQQRYSMPSPHPRSSTPMAFYMPKPHRIPIPPCFVKHSITGTESPLRGKGFGDSVLVEDDDDVPVAGGSALTMVSLPSTRRL